MRLILIGPMASGKSTVGRRLSKRLNLDFIDVDEEVEKSAGVSISWMFDVEGEKKFRERESKELINSLNADNCVIATGGGVILAEQNRSLLKKGTVIYLEISIQTQLERTLNDKNRPLLQKSDDAEQTLKELKEIRDPLFEECANITIKEGKNSHNEVVDEIIDQLNLK
ncbi:MAG TPA: shikimate kinase [SAR86 cluster bacterium]|jgi:shikimate kinase|nr:shikimate kinase [SAR86 cluster bacterium]HJM15072.1 shikimate kinase [SAR86 cluster bacterium]